MSTIHTIFIPSYGKDETKFERIPDFEGKTKANLFKRVVASFRMAGKVKDYVNEHKIDMYRKDSNYNGYGYSRHEYGYLMSRKDALTVKAMLEAKPKTKKTALSLEDRMKAWARRLHRLTGVSVEVCLNIANEKINYHTERINELIDRQNAHYSKKREKIINKQWRENPLRRITDEEHANNILKASLRHNNSNYEYMLEVAREKALQGEIEYSDIQQYARDHTTYWGDIESQFFGESDAEDDEIEEE